MKPPTLYTTPEFPVERALRFGFRGLGAHGVRALPQRVQSSEQSFLPRCINPKRAAIFEAVRKVMSRWQILALTTGAFLAGCAVGPNYERPRATTIPAAYTGATDTVSTDATNIWKVAEPGAQFPK